MGGEDLVAQGGYGYSNPGSFQSQVEQPGPVGGWQGVGIGWFLRSSSNTLTFCYSQWKADAEQFLNLNVLVSDCKSSVLHLWGCALWCVSGRKYSSFMLEAAGTDPGAVSLEQNWGLGSTLNQMVVSKHPRDNGRWLSCARNGLANAG